MQLSSLVAAASKGRIEAKKIDGRWYSTKEAVKAWAGSYKPVARKEENFKAADHKPKAPKGGKCPECTRVNPPCGWMLPFEDDNEHVIIVCRDCFDRLCEAA